MMDGARQAAKVGTGPSLALLSLGGTIASTPDVAAGGAVPLLLAADLLARVETGGVCVTPCSFRQVPGAHLTVDDLLLLSAEVRARFDAGADGVVITQGTDTLEETAFALDLLVPDDNPVVVTGAMRAPASPGADGAANLKAAILVAASPMAWGLGTMVVMSDQIHAARFVTKRHTTSPSAFGSPTVGPLGWISEERVHLALRPNARLSLPGIPTGGTSDVALLTSSLGDDARLARLALEGGFGGIVVEATGGGHVSPAMAAVLAGAADRLPIVIASRTGAGSTLVQSYGFVGSEVDLQQRGLIYAGWLDGPKAKLYLDLLLRSGIATVDAVRDRFRHFSD